MITSFDIFNHGTIPCEVSLIAFTIAPVARILLHDEAIPPPHLRN